MEWSDLAPHLIGHAHLATVHPDGSPHVSKVWPGVEGDVIWIATRASSRKARNVVVTPQAALMFEPAGEFYVHADVETVADLATKQRLWDSGVFAFPMAGFFGSPDHPDFVLLRLTPTRATAMMQGENGIHSESWHR